MDSEYYTDAISYTKIKMLETFDSSPVEGNEESEVSSQGSPQLAVDREEQIQNPKSKIQNRGVPTKNHGEVQVNTQVVGFKKIKFHTNENVGSGELTLPEQEMHTTAYWLTLPNAVLEALPYSNTDRQDGVHGLGNALRAIATLLVMCDARDLGVAVGENANRDTQSREQKAKDEPFNSESQRPLRQQRTQENRPRAVFEPNIYLYDKYPGGVGFSEPLYRMNDSLLANTFRLIADCPCQAGCPSCVGPGGEVGARGKEVALAILRAVSCQ